MPRHTLRLAVPLGLLAVLSLAYAYGPWFGEQIDAGTPRRIRDQARSEALAIARKTCQLADLDVFVDEQRALTERNPASADDWRVLAEAYLERALARGSKKGMQVGQPVYSKLPERVRQDLDLGEAALRRAREAGDASSDSYRIEAALKTMRITGIAAAIRFDGAVRTALDTATQLDNTNPHALVGSACRKLFKPVWLGGDPAAARVELIAAAEALPHDERPLMFASMAAWLEEEHEAATQLMERASKRNPTNPYVAAVLKRLRAGEDEPFARDVD